MTPRKNVHPVSTSFVPTQVIIDQATVDALEGIIAECKKKRETIGSPLHYPLECDDHEHHAMGGHVNGCVPDQEARDQGFRGALAWVEGLCCQEINRVRGVVKG